MAERERIALDRKWPYRTPNLTRALGPDEVAALVHQARREARIAVERIAAVPAQVERLRVALLAGEDCKNCKKHLA